MSSRLLRLAAVLLTICGLASLPACDFFRNGDGNSNTNSNTNSNANDNDNDGNTNSNVNANSNTNDNSNVNTNDNDNDNANENDNDNGNGNDNDNDNGNDNTDDEFAEFTDPETGLKTTLVYDANRDTAQFRTSDDSIVIDGVAYQPGSWEVNGNFLDAAQSMEAQFGTDDGVRRAFFTLTGDDNVCDFFIEDGQFMMVPTNEPIPNDE